MDFFSWDSESDVESVDSDCTLASVKGIEDIVQKPPSSDNDGSKKRNHSSSADSPDSNDTAVPAGPSKPFKCMNCGHEHIIQQYVSPLPSHLLETNDPPLQSEEASLQRIIQEADFDKEISSLDDTASRLENLLRAVKLRRTELRASALAAKGVVSAIRRVPREIIIRIVLYALEDGDALVQPTTLDVTKGPWIYSQVCRLWREEILGYRSIWSNLEIRQKEDDAGCKNWPAVLENVFSRAALHRGNLRFQLHLRNDSGLAKDLIQSIISKSWRWEEATLIIPRALLGRLKRLKGRIPVLQSMRLGHTSSSELDSKCIAKSFEDALALRRLSLEDFRDIQTLAIPWDQLTDFDAGTRSRFPVHLLAKLSSLTSLTVTNYFTLGTPIVIALPHLRTLNLSSLNHQFVIAELLASLTLPALEELGTTGLAFQDLVPLLRRSKCHIKRLTVHDPLCLWGTAFDKIIGQSLLAELSSLETLDLTSMRDPQISEFLELMNGTACTPQLNTIIISPSALYVRAAFDCLKTTISLRKDGSLRYLHFKRLDLLDPNYFETQIPKRYAKLKRLGGEKVEVKMV
ncbi:hypothetical protein C8J56DRAFT_384868 [Mycena floridula]|nr:hypothetical protein C8J56DRAFT_384868 [Mycena floridula]